jgi:hypothetical protein
MLVGFGVGMFIEICRIGTIAIFHIDESSAWPPFITGFITYIVVVLTVAYFCKNGRDKCLMPRGSKQDETKSNQE